MMRDCCRPNSIFMHDNANPRTTRVGMVQNGHMFGAIQVRNLFQTEFNTVLKLDNSAIDAIKNLINSLGDRFVFPQGVYFV